MTFNVGDIVEWTSQSAGITRTKVGAVFRVVPPGAHPGPISKNHSPGMERDHESYVVRVAGHGLYWPRVSLLRPANPVATP